MGSVFTKKNVEDVFALSKLKNVNSLKNEEIKDEEASASEAEVKEEVKEEKKTDEKPREQQLTMSDFFEEFKI